MSELGHKRTLPPHFRMSALTPKADIETQSRNVRFVPIADITARLFDHLVERDARFALDTGRACGDLMIGDYLTCDPDFSFSARLERRF